MRHRVRTRVGLVAITIAVSMVLLPSEASATITRTPLWNRAFTPWNHAVGTAVAVDPTDTTVYVGGATTTRPKRFLVAAYATDTGQLRWLVSYPCGAVPSDGCWLYPDSLAVSPDSTTLYFTGSDQTGDDTRDLVTMALDTSSGAQRWVARSKASALLAPRMAMSPTGDRIFVAGPVGPVDAPSRWGERVLAYATSTGDLLWHVRIAGIASASPQTLLGVGPDGASVFLSVTERDEPGERVETLALRASTGATVWVRRFGRSSALNLASDLAVAPDGTRVYVADYRYGYMPGGEGEMIRWPATLAYGTAHGRLLWKSVEEGAISDCMHIAISASRAHVFVTDGYGVGSLAARTGRSQWVTGTATLPGMWSDFDFKLAVSADGERVYASESLSDAYTDTRSRLETVALNTSTGAIRWTAVRRKVPWGEMAVGPSGARVYVAGTLTYEGGGYRGVFIMAYAA
jgi:outer membrane protein assembly factor BamB